MANGSWTPENSDSNQARPFHRADQYWSYLSNDNSYWFENMAYLRLKNVTLNYMLPQTLTKKVGVSRADLFFSGYNLFMLYSAQNKFDAEVADPESLSYHEDLFYWSEGYILRSYIQN
jgi:hypothetical protein